MQHLDHGPPTSKVSKSDKARPILDELGQILEID